MRNRTLSAAPGMSRRASYAAPIWSPDYFIVRRIRAFVTESIHRFVRPGVCVLDAGCGEQPFRSLIERHEGSYTGLDVVQNRTGSVQIVAPLWDCPLPSASFDLIVATEVLEHVSDTAAAFRELHRLLKPAGTIIATTPFIYPLHEEPHDYVRLTPASIAWHAARAGLVVETVVPAGNEIEALALLFGNLLSRAVLRFPFVIRAVFGILRLPATVLANAAAVAVASLSRPLLPQKAYLNTFCILQKP